MKKLKRFKRVYGINHPCSGGIRVREEGIIEIRVEAVVLSGYHNERTGALLVLPGYRLYSHFGFGSWTDVIPVWACKHDAAYAWISEHGNGDARERRNQKFVIAKLDHQKI